MTRTDVLSSRTIADPLTLLQCTPNADVRQLRGQAGDRQVPNAEVALVHTMGGTILELEANACTVGILKRVT